MLLVLPDIKVTYEILVLLHGSEYACMFFLLLGIPHSCSLFFVLFCLFFTKRKHLHGNTVHKCDDTLLNWKIQLSWAHSSTVLTAIAIIIIIIVINSFYILLGILVLMTGHSELLCQSN